MKPIKVPIEALITFFIFKLPIISPENAPIKGPIIIPKGPRIKKPINRPIVAPIIPLLVPPNFFKPTIGIIISKKNTNTAIIKLINRNLSLNSILDVKLIVNKPSQLVIGPGIIGTKLPISPTIHKINPRTINNKSIKILIN